MVAMLKIASGMKYDGKSDYVYHGEYQEEWKDWNAAGIYKEFVEKVFMKEEVYAGYEAVIDRLREEADKVVQEDSERKWIDSIMDDLKDLY